MKIILLMIIDEMGWGVVYATSKNARIAIYQ